MHLDVARHFYGPEQVKRFLDHLAMYKFNRFHWHLTDDQGWRIEIKGWPKLTEVGAWRTGTQAPGGKPARVVDGRYGGFYTQEEIRDVVAHARRLHIDIVPEIDVPGHSQAAVASYPALGAPGPEVPVATLWSGSQALFDFHEETFRFLDDVLDQLRDLFPGSYIHIGGDEAPVLTRYKSREWLAGVIRNPRDRAYFGGTKTHKEMEPYPADKLPEEKLRALVEYLTSLMGDEAGKWDAALSEQGRKIFAEDLDCNTCHEVKPGETADGPNLAESGSRAWIQRVIRDASAPDLFDKVAAMPRFGKKLPEEDIRQLAELIAAGRSDKPLK